jgi:uncharacterized protein YdeI (YjbR/CyaY-like superfamily)
MRMLKFTDVSKIDALEPVIRAYLLEAVEAEKAGLEIAFQPTASPDVPEEFRSRLNEMPGSRPPSKRLRREGGAAICFTSPSRSNRRRAQRASKTAFHAF